MNYVYVSSATATHRITGISARGWISRPMYVIVFTQRITRLGITSVLYKFLLSDRIIQYNLTKGVTSITDPVLDLMDLVSAIIADPSRKLGPLVIEPIAPDEVAPVERSSVLGPPLLLVRPVVSRLLELGVFLRGTRSRVVWIKTQHTIAKINPKKYMIGFCMTRRCKNLDQLDSHLVRLKVDLPPSAANASTTL